MQFKIDANDVLIIVDVQRDFCPGGALPVPDGDKVVPILNEYIKRFKEARTQIYATRDWHPSNHISFQAYGGIWPAHCIQNSEGAAFHPDLTLPDEVKIVSKATDSSKEAYSGFDPPQLKDKLERTGIKRIFIGGLATDYCVKSTVLDALELGFETILLTDAIQGVNVNPGDSEKAIEEMISKGAITATLTDLQ
ncbi:MAG: bifunctional nicotinamidase/pyrazinamidase [Candidatus Heimdallarchaeota archaeon]